jgi:large subunit ribosomal protein L32
MAVPKKRSSRSVRDMRRAHHALEANSAVEPCPNCGEVKLRHHMCESCGNYRGKVVVERQAEG